MLLEKYNPIWVTQFNAIENTIEAVMGTNVYTFEHIGSTAIPNLDAKPIIDIDIVFESTQEYNYIQQGLENIGYYHNGNQGIEGREVFKRSGNTNHPVLDTVLHHLYVCAANSAAFERHILTRNYLRKNEWARIQYQQLKYNLAEKANQNRKEYQALKEVYINPFLDTIIEYEKTGS